MAWFNRFILYKRSWPSQGSNSGRCKSYLLPTPCIMGYNKNRTFLRTSLMAGLRYGVIRRRYTNIIWINFWPERETYFGLHATDNDNTIHTSSPTCWCESEPLLIALGTKAMLGTPTSELWETQVSIATDQHMYIGSVRDPVAGKNNPMGKLRLLLNPKNYVFSKTVIPAPGAHPASQKGTIS
jgi:hypothetical protein